jgi:hypothetical protein
MSCRPRWFLCNCRWRNGFFHFAVSGSILRLSVWLRFRQNACGGRRENHRGAKLRTLTPHTLELFFPLLKTIRNNGIDAATVFYTRRLLPRSPKTSRRGRRRGEQRLGVSFCPDLSRVSELRAAVAQLPVNNRPETGSPRHASFSTATGWFFPSHPRPLLPSC